MKLRDIISVDDAKAIKAKEVFPKLPLLEQQEIEIEYVLSNQK